MFKIFASFAAENMGKKGYYQVWAGQKVLHCMKSGTQQCWGAGAWSVGAKHFLWSRSLFKHFLWSRSYKIFISSSTEYSKL